MNEVTTPAPGADAEKLVNLKQLTLIIYILYAVSAFVGLTGIVAIIINYVKRDDTVGTIYESHFTWQIRTFWWSLLWAVIGFAIILLTLGFGIVIGGPILFVDFVWCIYRIVKGFLNLNDGKPMVVP
jgi:uncharacterized membrane protein